jgi:hypothetical protein
MQKAQETQTPLGTFWFEVFTSGRRARYTSSKFSFVAMPWDSAPTKSCFCRWLVLKPV